MTPLEWKEIEHELENTPTPAPPDDLLGRIHDDIPTAEELRVVAGDLPARSMPKRSPRRWLMAASALVAISASFLAYRVGLEPDTATWAPSVASEAAQPAEAELEETPKRLEGLGYIGGADTHHEKFEARGHETPIPRPTQSRQAAPAGPELAPNAARDRAQPTPKPRATARRDDARLSKFMAEVDADRSVGATAPSSEVAAAPRDGARTGVDPTTGRDLAQEKSSQPSAEYLARRRELMSELKAMPSRTAPPPAPGDFETKQEARVQSAEYINVAEAPTPSVVPSTGGTAEPNDAPYGDVFFDDYGTNPFIDTEDDRLSTFGLDVDTGSYTVARRYLSDGNLPPRDAIRVEEFVNYFDYRDAPPRRGDFALTAEAAPSLFGGGPRHQIVRFNIAGRVVSDASRKPATLVFVVDVSGSMARENRLGLVKQSLGLMLDELKPDDRVGLVIYGSRAEVLLEPTSNHERIRHAIGRLRSGGSTNAEEGLLAAYRLISDHRRSSFEAANDDEIPAADRSARRPSSLPHTDRIHRIILCSDGVANVGNTGPASILERIEGAAAAGIELTTVGFGMGNYNDVLMEQLADRGDGAYAYVDTLQEARRIFVENLTGTLQTIASDAKIQVDFNPEVVSRYRLLGYENRAIADEDFRNDAVDAGEIGAGHSVTALYEIKLHPEANPRDTLATLHLRYRSKRSGRVEEVETKLQAREVAESWNDGSPALRLASIVGEFAEVLKGAYWAEGRSLTEVLPHAQRVSAEFPGDPDVAELVSLIGKASRLEER